MEQLYEERHRHESAETKRIVNDKFKRLMKHSDGTLTHHGVPGMRWGVRKNNSHSAKINTPHGWAIKKIRSKLRERSLNKQTRYRNIRKLNESQLRDLSDRVMTENTLRSLGKFNKREPISFKLNAKRHYLNRTNMTDKEIKDVTNRLSLESKAMHEGGKNLQMDKQWLKKIKSQLTQSDKTNTLKHYGVRGMKWKEHNQAAGVGGDIFDQLRNKLNEKKKSSIFGKYTKTDTYSNYLSRKNNSQSVNGGFRDRIAKANVSDRKSINNKRPSGLRRRDTSELSDGGRSLLGLRSKLGRGAQQGMGARRRNTSQGGPTSNINSGSAGWSHSRSGIGQSHNKDYHITTSRQNGVYTERKTSKKGRIRKTTETKYYK